MTRPTPQLQEPTALRYCDATYVYRLVCKACPSTKLVGLCSLGCHWDFLVKKYEQIKIRSAGRGFWYDFSIVSKKRLLISSIVFRRVIKFLCQILLCMPRSHYSIKNWWSIIFSCWCTKMMLDNFNCFLARMSKTLTSDIELYQLKHIYV